MEMNLKNVSSDELLRRVYANQLTILSDIGTLTNIVMAIAKKTLSDDELKDIYNRQPEKEIHNHQSSIYRQNHS